jgi:hypothetical protein
VPVPKVAAAVWLSSAAVAMSAAGLGVYQLTAGSTASASQPSSPTQGGGTITQGNGNGNNGNGNGNSGTGNPGHAITLTGTVAGKISPHSPATLNITIDNPNNQDIVVTSVSGSITSVTSAGLADRPVCSAAWYSVGAFAGPLTINKNKSAQVSVPLTLTDLPSTNQDNCKGSTVQFSFTAQAQQA